MSRTSRRSFLVACLALPVAAPACATDPPVLSLSGYYKNLFLKSETVAPTGQSYAVDVNRLRLELHGQLGPAVALNLQYDNELLFGSYLQTAQFRLQEDQPPEQYWRAESDYLRRSDYYGRHRLYRAHVTLSRGDTDVRLGRQRIPWGTGRFWSPLDLLNPIDPVPLERDERPGVDALLAEHKLGPLARFSAVYAPHQDRGAASAAVQWHANVGGVDYSLVAGRFRREAVTGFDLASQIGKVGVRAELTYARPRNGATYRRALLALDYAHANSLMLSAELYYNGAGAAERSDYDFAALFSGRIRGVARRYLGLYAGYELTPLLKWTNDLVANLDDGSRYFSPTLVYSIRSNLDWSLGLQHFAGKAGSEYGRFNDRITTYFKYYF